MKKLSSEFEENRNERRSFYCSNKLWFKLKEECKECYSVSWFICKAIEEKLEKKNKNITFK